MIPLGILGTISGAAAAAGAYELISTTILSASATQIDLTSIPQTYKHLQVRLTARLSTSGTSVPYRMRLNTATYPGFSDYYYHHLSGNGSTVTSGAGRQDGSMGNFVTLPGSTAAANAFGGAIIDILDYSSTIKYKTIRWLNGETGKITLFSGMRNVTAGITSIHIADWDNSGSFAIGSRFSLYGIRG